VHHLARIERLGLKSVLCPAAGISEDVALQMADQKGATLIVAVGSHDTASAIVGVPGRPPREAEHPTPVGSGAPSKR